MSAFHMSLTIRIFAAAAARAAEFAAFRAELVRRGREAGNPTARDYGDNDAPHPALTFSPEILARTTSSETGFA